MEAKLRRAEQQQENIKQAVRFGKATVSLEMLEEAKGKVQHLRA